MKDINGGEVDVGIRRHFFCDFSETLMLDLNDGDVDVAFTPRASRVASHATQHGTWQIHTGSKSLCRVGEKFFPYCFRGYTAGKRWLLSPSVEGASGV